MKTTRYIPETKTFEIKPRRTRKIEIGDSKQPGKLLEQIKIINDVKVENEFNLSLRLMPGLYSNRGELTASIDKGETVLSCLEIEHRYKELTDIHEGGYRWLLKLKKKPRSPFVRFTLNHKNLAFYKQPPLSAEMKARGDKQPEEAVGSYAIYYYNAAKGLQYQHNQYKAGKFGHILRIKFIAPDNREIWGDMDITKASVVNPKYSHVLTIPIPKELFQDDSLWQNGGLIIDPDFGYTTVGYQKSKYFADMAWGNIGTIGGAATGDSISCYFKTEADDWSMHEVKFALYDSSGNLLTNGQSDSFEWHGRDVYSPAWNTFDFPAAPSLSAGTYYVLSCQEGSTDFYYYYDFVSGQGYEGTADFDDFPLSGETITSMNFKPSLYCTYTEGGGGGGNISKIGETPWPNVGKVGGISKTNINKILKIKA